MSLKKKSAKRKGPTLPKTRSKPSDNFWDYIVLICGAKKIGKTSLFSHSENAFYAMFEPGGKGLSIYQRPIPTWDRWRRYVALLEKDKEFGLVVVDTADMAYEMCLNKICFDLGIDHPTDAGYGKGWHAVKREFRAYTNRVLSTGKGVAFISHAVEREVETRSGAKYSKLVSTMSGQCREMMEALVDIWIMYDYIGNERWLQVLGDDHVSAGHRLEGRFRYTDGTPIKFIPAGNSSQEAWENLQLGFSNELERPEEEPVRAPLKKIKKTKSRFRRS